MILINEITEPTAYVDQLVTAVSDLLATSIARDIQRISTERFRHRLAQQGFVTSTEELIQAIDQSGYASQVTPDEITLSNSLPDDMMTGGDGGTPEGDPEMDISKMAGDQALNDIKTELPQ